MRNHSDYLGLYSQVYPRYIPGVEWESFKSFNYTVNLLFYKMPYFIGIPQALLNFIVLTTVILITKHPRLGEFSLSELEFP